MSMSNGNAGAEASARIAHLLGGTARTYRATSKLTGADFLKIAKVTLLDGRTYEVN